jgi:hypothetical protein
VFADPAHGRALVECRIRANLDRGRPERVRRIFARQVPTRTPRAFPTPVLQHGVIPSSTIHDKPSALKPYLQEERALRTAMLLNNPRDFDRPRGMAPVADRVARGQTFHDRLLEQDQVPQDGLVSRETVRRRGESPLEAPGQRACARRLGDRRVRALRGALTTFGLIPGGLANKTRRQHGPGWLGLPPSADSGAQISDDLRRLRLKGLLARIPTSQQYVLTELGTQVAVFFTKLSTRLDRPGLAALVPAQPLPSPLAHALTPVSDLVQSAISEAHLAPAES